MLGGRLRSGERDRPSLGPCLYPSPILLKFGGCRVTVFASGAPSSTSQTTKPQARSPRGPGGGVDRDTHLGTVLQLGTDGVPASRLCLPVLRPDALTTRHRTFQTFPTEGSLRKTKTLCFPHLSFFYIVLADTVETDLSSALPRRG